MTSIIPSQCLACVHLDRSNTTPDGLLLPFQCAAYPQRIPDEIMLFGGDHRQERGDEEDGLIFELADGAEDQFEAWQAAFGEPSVTTAAAAPSHSDENFREYWTHGEGALLINWPVKGAFDRCVNRLDKYSEGGTAFDPEGLCAEYYHEVRGFWPGQKKKDHTAITVAASREYVRDDEGQFSDVPGVGGVAGKLMTGELERLIPYDVEDYASDFGGVVDEFPFFDGEANVRVFEDGTSQISNDFIGEDGETRYQPVTLQLSSDDLSDIEGALSYAMNIDLDDYDQDDDGEFTGVDEFGAIDIFDAAGIRFAPYGNGDIQIRRPNPLYGWEADQSEHHIWDLSESDAQMLQKALLKAVRVQADVEAALEDEDDDVVTAAAYGSGGCGPGQHRMPDGSCMDDAAMTAFEPGDLVARPGELWHAVFHTEDMSTGARVWLPGALSWREPPFAFHWELESGAHGGTPRVVQVGMATRALRDGNVMHAWGSLDMQDQWGGEYARKLAQGFVRGVSMGPGSEKIMYDQVWPAGLTAEQMAHAEPEQTVFTDYRVGELTGVSVPAQEGAFVEPTAELIALLGPVTAGAGEELGELVMEGIPVDTLYAPHRPALNCCRNPYGEGGCVGWKNTSSLHDPALCTCKATGKRGRCKGDPWKKGYIPKVPDAKRGRSKKAAAPGESPADRARRGAEHAQRRNPSDADKADAQRNIEGLMEKAKARETRGRRPAAAAEAGDPDQVLADLEEVLSGRFAVNESHVGQFRDQLKTLSNEGLGQVADEVGVPDDRKRTSAQIVEAILDRTVKRRLARQKARPEVHREMRRRIRAGDDAGTALIVTAGASGDTWTITVPGLPAAAVFAHDFPPGTPPTLTDDGRFFGYFAPGNTAHRSYARNGVRKTAKSLGRTDYSRWLKPIPVAGGDTVLAGPITMECMHAPTQGYGTLDRRHQAYEDTCSIIARATVGEDQDGSRWFAGQLMPGVTAEQVEKLLMCDLSLDSQPHPDRPGWQDFVGILAVPMGGWPVSRPAAVTRVVEQDGEMVVTASSAPIVFQPGVYISEATMWAIAGVDPETVVRENAAMFAAALKGGV